MDISIEIVWQLEQVFEPYRIMLKKLGGGGGQKFA
jgi:hypothetical protein